MRDLFTHPKYVAAQTRRAYRDEQREPHYAEANAF